MTLKKKYLDRTQKTKIFNLKVTDNELAAMRQNAEKYANGNLSAWIRFSSIELSPKKRHVE